MKEEGRKSPPTLYGLQIKHSASDVSSSLKLIKTAIFTSCFEGLRLAVAAASFNSQRSNTSTWLRVGHAKCASILLIIATHD